jgi:hypothetical protein
MYVSTANIPIGTIAVYATLTDGFVTPTVTGNVPDNVTPVEFDLNVSNPGDVSGVVYDVNGNPIPNVPVFLSDSNDPNVEYLENTADDGSFDFGDRIPGVITIQVYDNNNNLIGTSTGTLPYGGNVVINVNTNTVGAELHRPQLRPGRPAAVVASTQPSGASHPTQSKYVPAAAPMAAVSERIRLQKYAATRPDAQQAYTLSGVRPAQGVSP